VIQPLLLPTAAVAFDSIDMAEANPLLIAWGHGLGALNRPFGQEAYALLLDGRPISLAMSASTVSDTVQIEPDADDGPGRRLPREQVVELARLCSAPGYGWATRVMIRIWREVFAQRWPSWPPTYAISYQQNAKYRGDVYRFDGWTTVTTAAGKSGGGGAWTRKRYAADPAKGSKTLWSWRYAA
jgi:hypothetical protein